MLGKLLRLLGFSVTTELERGYAFAKEHVEAGTLTANQLYQYSDEIAMGRSDFDRGIMNYLKERTLSAQVVSVG